MLLCFLVGIVLKNYILCALPFLILFTALLIFDYKWLYWAILISLPLSHEWNLTDSLTLDFPAEPLMIILTGIWLIKFLKDPWATVPKDFFKHSLIQLVLLSFLWMLIVAIFSTTPVVSVKYLLAKVWYIVPFLFLTPQLIKSKEDQRKLFWFISLPMLFTILWTLIRFSTYNFEFDHVNDPLIPFYHNHVDYASLLSIMLPMFFVAWYWYKPYSVKRIFLFFSIPVVLFAIGMSFTRTCWLAVMVAAMVFFALKLKHLQTGVQITLAILVLAVGYITYENRFMRFAPEYSKTIYHHNLSDHLAATGELHDVSSAERLYRWVAAWEMFRERPLVGFGQGGFVKNYKNYSVSLFTTWVSSNHEQSTCHNYLLFVLVEQGIPGLLLFLIVVYLALVEGQRIYIQTEETLQKKWVLALVVMFAVVVFDNMLSDMIENIKVGPFFFMLIALLVIQDLKNKKVISES